MPTCERCGALRKYLHIHHITARADGGTDDPDNLQRLCPNCHEDVHGGPFGGTGSDRWSQTAEGRLARGQGVRKWITENPDAAVERNRKIADARRGKPLQGHVARPTISAVGIPISREDLEEAYVADRKSIRQIAKDHGVSHGAVSNWLAAYGIPPRRMGRPTGKGWSPEERERVLAARAAARERCRSG